MTDEDSTTSKVLLTLPIEYATTVYVHEDGYVVIDQPDPYSQETVLVLLSKSQAEQVYLALQEFVEGC